MDLYLEDYEDRRGLDGVRTKKVSAVYIASVNVLGMVQSEYSLYGRNNVLVMQRN